MYIIYTDWLCFFVCAGIKLINKIFLIINYCLKEIKNLVHFNYFIDLMLHILILLLRMFFIATFLNGESFYTPNISN